MESWREARGPSGWSTVSPVASRLAVVQGETVIYTPETSSVKSLLRIIVTGGGRFYPEATRMSEYRDS